MKIKETNRREFLGNSAKALASFIIVPRFVLGGQNAFGTKYLSPSDMVNLGFIGTGKQGNSLANSFLNTKEIKIVAAAEVYKAKLKQFIERTKISHNKIGDLGSFAEITEYNDFREILARKDIDAVVIATPDHWHAAVAVRAAQAGKDIYCEKPLALTIEEGRAMVNATRKYNRVFQTGSMQRSWPEFRHSAELIRNGYIGDIKSIKVSVGPPPSAYNLDAQPIPEGLDWDKWLGPNIDKSVFNAELAPPITKDVFPNWRNYREFGGGMVTDWGAHMFDIVQWALDMDSSGPTEVNFSEGSDKRHIIYKYANGITVSHEPLDWSSNAIHFIGTEGEIKVKRKKIETTPVSLIDKVIGENKKHVYFSDNHYKDFLNAMRKRSKPLCDVEIGHRTSSMCNIGNIAYQLDRPLKWNPKKELFEKDAEANALVGRKMNKEWGIKL